MNGYTNAAVQEPDRGLTDEVLSKNTGFPEPLSPYRNTTLPHPSADTSPSASIESADVSITRTHSRHSSFHLPRIGSSRHRPRASVSGPLIDSLQDRIQHTDEGKEKGVGELAEGNMNGAVLDAEKVEETENHRLDRIERRDEQGYGEGHERKKGILRKLQLHKV